MMRRWWVAVLVLACASGCFPVRYLSQASIGQAKLLAAGRPLSVAGRDPKTPPRIRRLISWVPELKGFGVSRGLHPTENYARYADLQRNAAVWVVQGCAPLKFETRRWAFPIVGTVPYLGFFEEPAARAYGAELARAEALDVDVRPAAAYSTLGWFRDPVLSTMISEGDDALGDLANVVLHESVHATFYVTGQSAFDESLASFVGDHLTEEWLLLRLGLGSREARAWVDSQRRYSLRVARFHRAYEELEGVYKSDAGDAEKRARKAAILAALKTELGTRRELNNATLAGFRTYDTGRPAFEKLLASTGNDWPRFWGAIKTLRPEDFPQPQMEDFSPVVEALVRTDPR